MGLLRYQQKRNFARTPEPRGKAARRQSRAPAFVIQKHAARRLHYDFRLEIGGVLKSWAVPKGIPLTKGDRRLAMQVEDHPLEYGDFEGTIPAGNYGAGTVMLWDKGAFEAVDTDPAEGLKQGKLRFALHGKKLRGEWTLVRMRGREEAGKVPWLLIKSGADAKPLSAKAEDQSVLTRRTMDQITKGRSNVWQSNRQTTTASEPVEKLAQAPRVKKAPAAPAKAPSAVLRAIKDLPLEAAGYVAPMKALLVNTPPPAEGWLFEIKWDGYRAIAVKRKGKVQLFSRRAREVTGEYPEIAEAVRAIPGESFVADGEIVVLDEHGHAAFQLLQNYKQKLRTGQAQLVAYYLFDLMNFEGRDLKGLPQGRRKELLEALLKGVPDPIRFSASFTGDPNLLLAEAKRKHIEGLIAKRADAEYEPDRRSGAWQKVKTANEQEFVIGGYTEPQGTRPYFGALLVGYYENGKLLFASKVGTGFDHATLKSLYETFQKFKTDQAPFANLPTRRPGKPGEGITQAEMKRCTWLKPKLVGEVRFSEWTRDGGLRQPVFLGLRDDKKPEEVVRERPAD